MPVVGPPVANLGQLREKENALSLSRSNRLHDPKTTYPLKLLDEKGVLSRQIECDWEEVVHRRLLTLSLLLEQPLSLLQVLDEQILAAQLLCVSIVIKALPRFEVEGIKTVVDPFALRPCQGPVGL